MTESLEQEIQTLRSLFWSERDPEGRGFVPLADAYRRAGDVRQALELLDEGLSRHPEFAPGHVVAARLYVEQGMVEEGEIAARRALDLDAENVHALISLVQALQGRDRGEEAAEVRDRLLALEPGALDPPGAEPSADVAAPEVAEPPPSASAVGLIDISGLAPFASEAAVAEPEPEALGGGGFDLAGITLSGTDEPDLEDTVDARAPAPDEAPSEDALDIGALAPSAGEAVFEIRELAPAAPADEEVDIASLAPDAEAEDVMDIASLAPEEVTEDVVDIASLAPEEVTEDVVDIASLAPEEVTEDVVDIASLAPEEVTEDIVDIASLAPEEVTEDIVDIASLAPEEVTEDVVDIASLAPDERADTALDADMLVPAFEDEVVDLEALEGGESTEDPREGRGRESGSAAPIYTRTLAELYVKQGFVDRALDVLRHLQRAAPADESLRRRIAEVEAGPRDTPDAGARGAPRRMGLPGGAEAAALARAAEEEVETLARDLAESGERGHEVDTPFAWTEQELEEDAHGPTIREYFDDLLGWQSREGS